MSREAVRVVTLREMRQRLRDRGFLLTTVLLLLLIVVPPFLIGGGGGDERYAVGSLDEESVALVETARRQAPLFEARVETRELDSREEAERLVGDGELDAVVTGERELIVEGDVDDGLRSLLASSAVLEQAGGGRAAAEDGRLQVTQLTSETRSEAAGLAALASLLLFLIIYLPSYFVASGVVEEKSSRVIEVILSSVRPRELLAGKVLGLGVLGLVQLVAILALGVLVAAGSGLLAAGPELVGVLVAVVVGFVLGFLFYGFLFAVSGAVVSRSEDLQYSQLAPTVVLFASFFASQSQASDAGTSLAQALALLPPTAPFMLPIRVGSGEAGAVEIAVSVALALAAIAVIAWAAGRLYSGSVLRFGGRVSLGEAWKG